MNQIVIIKKPFTLFVFNYASKPNVERAVGVLKKTVVPRRTQPVFGFLVFTIDPALNVLV